MSNVWFTSDLHWGHNAIIKYRRDFATEAEHRRVTKANILSVAKKRDILWVLGDSIFTSDALEDFQDLVDAFGQVRLVIGNHCGAHLRYEERQKLLSMCYSVYGLHKQYGVWLSHAPIHPQELFGKLCVHGHSHGNLMKLENGEIDLRYIPMLLELHDYMPRDLKWLQNQIEERKHLVKLL